MEATTSTLVKPVTPFTRVVFILAALLAVIAGIQLYFLTDHTDHYFAWTIAQPLSATFLGTGYWTGAALLLFAARERAWASIRVAVAAVAAFVPIMLLATLLHLDRFHLASPDLNAQIAAWAWIVVYAAVPFLVLAILVVQRRTPGGDPPRQAAVPVWLHVLIGANALVSLVLGLGLFLFPQVFFLLWPWQLTVLTAQAIGAGFCAVVSASVRFIRENAWNRSRSGTVSYLLIGSLQLIALARYPGTVEWSRPGTLLYILFMVGILIGGVYSTIAAWRRSKEPGTALAHGRNIE